MEDRDRSWFLVSSLLVTWFSNLAGCLLLSLLTLLSEPRLAWQLPFLIWGGSGWADLTFLGGHFWVMQRLLGKVRRHQAEGKLFLDVAGRLQPSVTLNEAVGRTFAIYLISGTLFAVGIWTGRFWALTGGFEGVGFGLLPLHVLAPLSTCAPAPRPR